MEKRNLQVGELPIPGKFYFLKNKPLMFARSLEDWTNWHAAKFKTLPKFKPFVFLRSILEHKEPGQVKHVWFEMLWGEEMGVCYNGQIPFHQFLCQALE